MDNLESTKFCAIIAAAYPGKFEVTDATIRVWQAVFANETLADMEAALFTHLKKSTDKWPPATGEINAILHKPDYPTATEAWEEVRTKVRRIGWYGSPEFSHPVVALTVNAIGWQVLCDMTNADVMRSNFIKLYETQCYRGAERAMLGFPELEGGDDRPELTDGEA